MPRPDLGIQTLATIQTMVQLTPSETGDEIGNFGELAKRPGVFPPGSARSLR